MRRMLVLMVVLMMPCASLANVVSAQYVQESVATKVDTSANANQTMAGTYTVSGTLMGPTPPLPSAD